jgi:hypothetical protein
MRVLLVHPSALMYSEIFLRLEPLGLERMAAALLADGHDVRLIDLQVYRKADLVRQVAGFQPEVVGFSLNYLANVPEVVDEHQNEAGYLLTPRADLGHYHHRAHCGRGGRLGAVAPVRAAHARHRVPLRPRPRGVVFSGSAERTREQTASG